MIGKGWVIEFGAPGWDGCPSKGDLSLTKVKLFLIDGKKCGKAKTWACIEIKVLFCKSLIHQKMEG